MASRTLPINTSLPPSRSRSFTRTNRYTGDHYAPSPPQPQTQNQGSAEEVSPVSSISSTESNIPAPARPSFSAFDEIHLESPRELPPLGLGLTNTTRPTNEAFRENFNRYNSIPPGGGLGNLGNLSRSNSSSSTSSRGSSRSVRSSVSSAGRYPVKPPAYTTTKEVKEEEEKGPSKKAAWWSLGKWSPLMWIQLLFFLGIPTCTLTWTVSLIYFTLLPRLFASKGKSLDDWVLEGVERDHATSSQEGITMEGTECMEVRQKMRRWEIATAAAAGIIWTLLCVALGILAVEATRKGASAPDYGSGDVVGEF